MNAFLFEVRAADPLIYLAISAMLVAVAVSACWIPARRAARVDPMQALHSA
jgi:ABC-type antimicrobial peptide transport system permease subunit